MSAGCSQVDRNCKTWYRWRCCSQHRPAGTLIPDITLVNIAETFSTGSFLLLRLKRFFLSRDVNVSSQENISIFFPFFSYPTIYYHRYITTTRLVLARRCVNERIDKGEKLVNFYGPPFLFHGITWKKKKKTILRLGTIFSYELLNLKNIRSNESLIAKRKKKKKKIRVVFVK